MNKTKLISIAVIVIALGAAAFFFTGNSVNAPSVSELPARVAGSDPKNATYNIEGKRVTLVNGVSETETAPGAASKITTRYFGNEVRTDLDGDGREDIAFLLTQNTGGSGTFYYVVGALNTGAGYVGSQGLLLGDRIAPQTTHLSMDPGHKNGIVVNYVDRLPGEPMTARPSMGKSIWLKLDPQTMQFGEVVQNFEGEADVSHMKLDMKTWKWIRTAYNDGKTITPRKAEVFTITFGKDGRFAATTDCNSISGTYSVHKTKISFGEMMSTMMYCEGSQEADFAKLLNETEGYHFTSRGELIFDFKLNSASATFK